MTATLRLEDRHRYEDSDEQMPSRNRVVDHIVGHLGAIGVDYIFGVDGAGLAAMLPGLPSVDVTDADAFSAAMRAALGVDGPSVVSIECAADEIPPFAAFLGPSVASKPCTKSFALTKENRTDVAAST